MEEEKGVAQILIIYSLFKHMVFKYLKLQVQYNFDKFLITQCPLSLT